MFEWVKSQVAMPNNEIPCILLRRDMDTLVVYPRFAEWDGVDWVDIDGNVVIDVVAWVKAPEYDNSAEEALRKLRACIENDKCEEKDCCYFVAIDLIESLLKYEKQ